MWSLVGAEFRKVADQIGRKTFKARKLGLVAARKAVKAETIETRWDGKETTNTTRPGDWIPTSHPNARCCWTIRATRTPRSSRPTRSPIYTGRSVYLSILAPWGEKQTAREGYPLLNGRDVYGNNAKTFDATYEVIH
jgi:hypothetical protein